MNGKNGLVESRVRKENVLTITSNEIIILFNEVSPINSFIELNADCQLQNIINTEQGSPVEVTLENADHLFQRCTFRNCVLLLLKAYANEINNLLTQ